MCVFLNSEIQVLNSSHVQSMCNVICYYVAQDARQMSRDASNLSLFSWRPIMWENRG